MSIFKVYATTANFEEYSGKTSTSLPSNLSVLLTRASELVKMCTRQNLDDENTTHMELAKLATCAQVQSWIEAGTSALNDAIVSSYTLGELSVSYAQQDISKRKLCTMAISYLNEENLLYKGMRW